MWPNPWLHLSPCLFGPDSSFGPISSFCPPLASRTHCFISWLTVTPWSISAVPFFFFLILMMECPRAPSLAFSIYTHMLIYSQGLQTTPSSPEYLTAHLVLYFRCPMCIVYGPLWSSSTKSMAAPFLHYGSRQNLGLTLAHSTCGPVTDPGSSPSKYSHSLLHNGIPSEKCVLR